MPFFRSNTPLYRGRKRSTDLSNMNFTEKNEGLRKDETLYETTDEPDTRQPNSGQIEHSRPKPPEPIHRASKNEPKSPAANPPRTETKEMPKTESSGSSKPELQEMPNPEPATSNPLAAVMAAPKGHDAPHHGSASETDAQQQVTGSDEMAQAAPEPVREPTENAETRESKAEPRRSSWNPFQQASNEQSTQAGGNFKNEAENNAIEQPNWPAYRGFDPLSIATSPGSYHISSESNTAQGYFDPSPVGRKESTGRPISVNLNQCKPGKPNKRGKPTVGKPIEQVRDFVILPDTKAYTEIGRFLVGRVEARYEMKLPVEDIKAIALTKGKPGEGVEIVDDETWRAARKMLEKGERGGGEERTKDENGREADLELWFVAGRGDGEDKKCVVM